MKENEEQIITRIFQVQLRKRGAIYSELWLPNKKSRLKPYLLIWIAWMDSRGFSSSLPLYRNFARFFANIGYPVLLYDQLGSGMSTGTFEFPKEQADQFIATVTKGKKIIRMTFNLKPKEIISIIGIGHSLGGVTLMHVVERGFKMKAGIFVSVPPSHGTSFKRGIIQMYGALKFFSFYLLSYLDSILGMIGKPQNFKFFGFTLRLKDIRRGIAGSHAILMARKHPEFPILAIFGDKDEYITRSDIERYLPSQKYPWIRRMIISGASHDMMKHQTTLFAIIKQFLEELDAQKRYKADQ